jgi:hypothetical protein
MHKLIFRKRKMATRQRMYRDESHCLMLRLLGAIESKFSLVVCRNNPGVVVDVTDDCMKLQLVLTSMQLLYSAAKV